MLDPRFAACVPADARVERLWTGGRWTEGPAWLDREQCLIWSDIPGNRMLRWNAADGAVAVFREPSQGGNGNTVDREGRLVTCEQYTRRLTRTEPDGRITVLVDNFEGRRFNAPNDVVVKSDGSVWFSDPDYGRSPLYEGVRELDGCHVYRFDPSTGETQQMTHDLIMPNGLAFSADERLLYIVDTGQHPRPRRPQPHPPLHRWHRRQPWRRRGVRQQCGGGNSTGCASIPPAACGAVPRTASIATIPTAP